MAETKTTTQTQQLPGADMWKKLADEQVQRMTQMFDESAKWHAQWVDYGNTQIAEMGTMAKQQFKYANDLAADWRKLAVDTTKKATEFFVR